MFLFQSTAYGWLMLGAVLLSLVFWIRLARRDERLMLIYVAALAGAFVGAKLVYLAAEGWQHWQDPHRWLVLATGKSITGALLGGYTGVELAKHGLGYRQRTGDWFAGTAVFGIMLGRIGCILHGCCLGRVCEPSWWTVSDPAGTARWPAAWVELLFNALMLGTLALLKNRRCLPGQHFHLYLIAYGLFRFGHEFLRDTPRLGGIVSGYQIAATAVFGLGAAGFALRRAKTASGSSVPLRPAEALERPVSFR